MASASKSTTLYDNGRRPYTLTASFTENSTSVANNTSNILNLFITKTCF